MYQLLLKQRFPVKKAKQYNICDNIIWCPKSWKILDSRRRVHGKLKECVTINARGKIFLLKKDKSAVIAERKQFLLILGLLIAVHKSQGSTLAYMQFYINQSTRKKTVMWKN